MRGFVLVVVGSTFLGLSVATSVAKSGVTLEDRRQAACYDDVQRLCGEFMPDVDKIEACMKTKRAKVSKRCAAMYDVTE